MRWAVLPGYHIVAVSLTQDNTNWFIFTLSAALLHASDIPIPYSRVIRRISHISAYSLISAYVFAATNIHC